MDTTRDKSARLLWHGTVEVAAAAVHAVRPVFERQGPVLTGCSVRRSPQKATVPAAVLARVIVTTEASPEGPRTQLCQLCQQDCKSYTGQGCRSLADYNCNRAVTALVYIPNVGVLSLCTPGLAWMAKKGCVQSSTVCTVTTQQLISTLDGTSVCASLHHSGENSVAPG